MKSIIASTLVLSSLCQSLEQRRNKTFILDVVGQTSTLYSTMATGTVVFRLGMNQFNTWIVNNAAYDIALQKNALAINS